MKIMIVDDHAEMRRLLKSIVSLSVGDSVEFIECESGEEAIEQYEISNPSCVLMDIELKRIDGFYTTQKIFKYDSDARVIIVTSHSSPSIRSASEELGVFGFVTKDNLSGIPPLLHTIKQSLSL